MQRLFRSCATFCVAWPILAVLAGPAGAQTVVPSLYTTSIRVQNEAEGTEFNDWAAVPTTITDPVDNPGDSAGRPFVDIAGVQLANDDDFLYVHVLYHNTSSINMFLGFDTDQNTTTGFDVLQIGQTGTEFGYQNDFPFQQAAGIFNIGVSLTGGPLTNGGALIYPFWNVDGSQKEYAIPRDVMLGFPAGAPGFPTDSFDLVVYTDEGGGDITETNLRYTFATAPTLAGDYNDDGSVDAADYTVWRDSLGSLGMNLPADGTGDDLLGVPDGDVDAFDYNYWKANFPAGGPAIGASVPEPTALVMAAVCLLGLGLRRS